MIRRAFPRCVTWCETTAATTRAKRAKSSALAGSAPAFLLMHCYILLSGKLFLKAALSNVHDSPQPQIRSDRLATLQKLCCTLSWPVLTSADPPSTRAIAFGILFVCPPQSCSPRISEVWDGFLYFDSHWLLRLRANPGAISSTPDRERLGQFSDPGLWSTRML
jgi:hypothetical protein